MASSRSSGGGETDGATNDNVAQLGGTKGEERRDEQRVAPQTEADHQQGEQDEGGRVSTMGSERDSRREGIRGLPTVIEGEELTLTRTRSRSGSTGPAQTDPEGEQGTKYGEGCRKKERMSKHRSYDTRGS